MSELHKHYAAAIAEWEPPQVELVRQIDDGWGTLERIVKCYVGGVYQYSLYRYFEFRDDGPTQVSVDLSGVSADRIIQHLAERI